MAKDILGCVNIETGEIIFEEICNIPVSGCFIREGEHAGQVKVVIDSGLACDDTYYADVWFAEPNGAGYPIIHWRRYFKFTIPSGCDDIPCTAWCQGTTPCAIYLKISGLQRCNHCHEHVWFGANSDKGFINLGLINTTHILRQTSGCYWEKTIPDAVVKEHYATWSCTNKMYEEILTVTLRVSLASSKFCISASTGVNQEIFAGGCYELPYTSVPPMVCFDGSIQYRNVIGPPENPPCRYDFWGQNGYAQVSSTGDDF